MSENQQIGYVEVMNRILDMIRAQGWVLGDRLPAERELAALWNVGRPTINKAIACLIAQGHLRRDGYKLLVGSQTSQAPPAVPPIHFIHPHVGRSAMGWVRHGLLEAAHDVAASLGSHTIPKLYYHLIEQRHLLLQIIKERSAGVLLWPADGSIADLLVQIKSVGIPLVTCDLDLSSGHFVGTDNELGIGLAMEHLALLGHRHIAYLTNESEIISLRRRLQGFQHACTTLGLKTSLKRVSEMPISEVPPLRDWLSRLLAAEPSVTAVCCSNDRLALPLIAAAKALGLAIPSDLSIVGFDDVDQAASADPPLTTVAQDFYHLGTTAAQLVFQLMREQTRDIDSSPVRLRLEPRLIVRGSTAQPSKRPR